MDPNQNQSNDMGPPPPAEQVTAGKLDLESLDWPDVRLALLIIIDAQKKAPKKSRERALVITKLEEARMWAGEAMMTE